MVFTPGGALGAAFILALCVFAGIIFFLAIGAGKIASAGYNLAANAVFFGGIILAAYLIFYRMMYLSFHKSLVEA